METAITSYCKIKNNAIWVNGQLVTQGDAGEELPMFLGNVYKQIVGYPKFFKMDKQCKLGVVATEYCLRNMPGFEDMPKDETALVFANNAGSLDSDRNHARTIADKENYFPSPAVFVYTLPNIVTGEIAIKHKLTGENAFFISEKFDAALMHNYTSILLKQGNTSIVICGWINVDGANYEAFVYCVKKLNFKQENMAFQVEHSREAIEQLYER